MGYIQVIKYAALFFPILCMLLTIPFLIHHYRKYGSITFLRFLLVFSFFFYLSCVYFLVVMPLPTRTEVLNYNGPRYNLKPFFVVPEMFMSGKFNILKPETYYLIFNESYVEPLFNILMTIPFGIYLRYYFKCGFIKTLCLSFLLSLFFELTQLTGLYFLYPRSYRLCDVNDLINNTTGGVIGFLIAPLFSSFLPSRESIDDKSYSRGRNVSVLRKGVSLVIDYSFILMLCISSVILFHLKNIEYMYIILSFVVFALLPYFSSGYTFGKWLMQYRLVGTDLDSSIPLYKHLIKWVVLHFIILNGWFIASYVGYNFNVDIVFSFIIYFTVLGLFLLYCLFCLILNRDIFINKILKITSDSVIDIDGDDDAF